MNETQEPAEAAKVLQFPSTVREADDVAIEPDGRADDAWNADYLASMALQLVTCNDVKPANPFEAARECLAQAAAIMDEQELRAKAERILGPSPGPGTAA